LFDGLDEVHDELHRRRVLFDREIEERVGELVELRFVALLEQGLEFL